MGFQAFQLPQPGTAGVNAGMEGLTNTLSQVAQQDLQRQQMAAQNLLRQKEIDVEQRRLAMEQSKASADSRRADQQDRRLMGEEHMKIAQLWKSDPHLAASYVNALGGKATAEPVYGEAPKTDPLTQDEANFADTLPQNRPDELDSLMSASHGTTPEAQPAPSPAPAAPQGPLVGHRLRYSIGGGPETVLDPLEHQQIQDAQEQRQVAQLDQASLPPKYRMILSARLSMGEAPKDAWEGISNMMKADEERAFKEQQAKTYQMTADQKYRVGMMGANAKAQSAAASAGSKQDAASARAQGLLERAGNDIDKLVNWKDLQTMDNKTRLALGELATNHALPERDAKVLAASIFRGGVPTSGEMHELYANLGGTMDAWERFKSNALQGRLDPLQREQLQTSLQTAADVVKERKMRALKTVQARLGPGSGYETMGPQVNRVLQSRAVQAGIDDFPNLYDESNGPGAVLLGSTKKPAKTVAAAGTNPLVSAAKVDALPPADQALAKQALSLKPGDKNYESAQHWLQVHKLR